MAQVLDDAMALPAADREESHVGQRVRIKHQGQLKDGVIVTIRGEPFPGSHDVQLDEDGTIVTIFVGIGNVGGS